jgi:hypothetical protein
MLDRPAQRRLSLVLPETSAKRLDTIKEITEASTYTDVIKDALRFYEYFVLSQAEGYIFVRRHNNTETGEVVSSPWQNAPADLAEAVLRSKYATAD